MTETMKRAKLHLFRLFSNAHTCFDFFDFVMRTERKGGGFGF